MKHQTLRQARLDKELTQAELSDRSGVAQSRIAEIESGKTADPNNSTVKALEEALGLRRGTLVFGPEALAS